MADDAGALLVRSGLIGDSQLLIARQAQSGLGGTLGEQLVSHGFIADDVLASFYRRRLMVPQVNPNVLARISPRVGRLDLVGSHGDVSALGTFGSTGAPASTTATRSISVSVTSFDGFKIIGAGHPKLRAVE